MAETKEIKISRKDFKKVVFNTTKLEFELLELDDDKVKRKLQTFEIPSIATDKTVSKKLEELKNQTNSIAFEIKSKEVVQNVCYVPYTFLIDNKE